MAVVEFDSTATVTQGFTSNPALLITAINAAASSGFTNWEDSLLDARGLFPNRASNPDLIIFASDGNPTASNTGGGNDTGQPNAHLDATVNEANAAKASGIRILTIGIGADLTVTNLHKISSEDATFTTGFDTLAQVLAGIASSSCGGTVTVQKVIDTDGNIGTTADQTTTCPIVTDWAFAAATNEAGDTVAPPNDTSDSSGIAGPFQVTPDADNNAVLTITETLKMGFSFISMLCVRQDGPDDGTAPDAVTVTPVTNGGTITVQPSTSSAAASTTNRQPRRHPHRWQQLRLQLTRRRQPLRPRQQLSRRRQLLQLRPPQPRRQRLPLSRRRRRQRI